MAASPLDGMYLFFSIPLGLANLIVDVITGNQNNPNTPQVHTQTALRQWFSQPRPAQGSAPKLTLFTTAGTGGSSWATLFGHAGSYQDNVGAALDPAVWTVQNIPLTTNWISTARARTLAITNVVAAINATPGKFALCGYSLGAEIMSEVYKLTLPGGSLAHRAADLIAGVTFGNPEREAGHTIPGGIDPGGHGVRSASQRLVNTPSWWWDFAQGGPYNDIFTTAGDDTGHLDLTASWEATYEQPDNYPGILGVLGGLFAGLFTELNQIGDLVQLFFQGVRFSAPISDLDDPDANRNGHVRYQFPYPGSTSGLSAVTLAINYLTQVGATYQASAALVPVTEVLQVNFKLPLSVSEVGWDALRVSSRTEVWYLDRQNNWRQVLDESRIPVTLNLSTSSVAAWYKAHFYCYPIVAKALQWRFSRVPDPVVGNKPYCVGMKNGLIRRNIYTRSDGTQGIEPQQDPLGNTITSYIKDWDAAKAFDNDPHTYWRSAPMPDPNAVASLYLDCRSPAGGPQLIDTLYMDPVYANQTLNLYYSNDDTVGTLKLSPVSAVAAVDNNTDWQRGKGRWDTSFDPGSSAYHFQMNWGPLVRQDTWIGMEWTPDFAAAVGPAQNPVLFSVAPSATTGTQYWPKIFYDVGAGQIVLELTNGSTARTFTAPLSPVLVRYQPLRIVVGWGYAPKTVFISVRVPNGTEVAHLSQAVTDLPDLITLDGQVGFIDFRGLFTAHVIKLENWSVGQGSFQANPQVYVSPDPVMPDPSGNIPATTLDNAIYAAAWASQEHGTGGDHESRYDNKVWTPIWKNYFSQKAKLFFPQQINLKYLKCEFTHLTEEPYPVYDSGIQVSYKVFPVSVTQTVTTRHPGLLGLLTVGADVLLNNIGSVNWLSPASINNAVNSVFGQVVSPVDVTFSAGTVTNSLPNTSTLDLAAQTRREVSSPYVYKRPPITTSALASSYLTTSTSSGATGGLTDLEAASSTVMAGITDSFAPLTNFIASPTGQPSQGSDWWVFPGGLLQLPAVIMNGLTAITQTIFGRPNTTVRQRFNTTSVHRYDIKTAVRDAAVAYFAGVREVQPYVTTYISELDPTVFAFSRYDPSQWVLSNVKALDSGPITTAGATYALINGNFDIGIDNWNQTQGSWVWDPHQGHWFLGAAHVSADGTRKELTSSLMDVTPGAHVSASVWVKWAALAAANNSTALQLEALYYLNGAFVSASSQGLNFALWAAAGDWTQISATFAAPAGVNSMRLGLVVTTAATAGDVWFDTVIPNTTDMVEATAFKDFITTSTFAKVRCSFTDSGVVRSDAMWARLDPNDLNISNTALAYYTSTIPDVIPGGMWGDTFATWADADITWGAPRALVAINVDPDRIFDGKRVLHFTRAPGAGEAGVKVRQSTNFVSNALFRIGAVFFKPNANTNQVTLRLRRVSDGVYIHEETFNPQVGYWYEYVTDFIEIPASGDQEYTCELVCTGDNADEFYLNDLYTEIAPIRYFMRLGASDAFLHDVTQLRYADSAIVSATQPVNEFSIQLAIMSPQAYAYGCAAEPVYLK